MPKSTTDELQGYHFMVQFVEVPSLDEHGHPVINGDGPVMEKQIILGFVDQGPLPGQKHVVQMRMNEGGRDELVHMLTGGLYVASSLPPQAA